MEDNELINFEEYAQTGGQSDLSDSNPELAQQISGNSYEEDPDYSEDQYDPEEDLFGKGGASEKQEQGESQYDNYEPTDLVTALLRDKGYNPDKIEIQNENGQIETVRFDDLSIEEQRQILNTPDVMLTNEEIETINFLRQNNTTLRDVVAYREQLAVQNASRNSANSKFLVDDATDEQLFVADLKSKYPDLTDDELADELEDAKYNEETFKKKVTALRDQYKKIEEQERKDAELAIRQEEEQNWNQAYQSLLQVAQNTDTLYSLDIDDLDKDDVMRFLLERDATGKTEFLKLLDNPTALFHLAWFATKGGQAFTTIHQFYQQQLDTMRKGANKQEQPSNRPSSVRRAKSTKTEDPYDMGSYFK